MPIATFPLTPTDETRGIMSKHLLLPFGLKKGVLFRIDEVDSGLACDCYCPGCGGRLIARKGASRMPHFSHYRGDGCAYGLESALHLRAKEVLERAKRLVLPAVYLPNWTTPLFPKRTFTFDRAIVERRFGQITPDLMVRVWGRYWILLEIAVTHPVDHQKLRTIRRMKYPAAEIDMNGMFTERPGNSAVFDEDRFQQLLLKGVEHKRWLFHPKRERLEYAIRQRAARKTVRHSKTQHRHYYRVKDCPRQVRRWPLPVHPPSYYALVFQDCLHCAYCAEIVYRKEFRGFKEVCSSPETVWCWGHLDLEDMWK